MNDEGAAAGLLEPRATEEERAMVRHALRLLGEQSPNEAAVIDLYYLMEVPEAEIAEHLHVPVATVRRWLRRGRRRLRTIIERLSGEMSS